MIQIRPADSEDIKSIVLFDAIAQTDSKRVEYLDENISSDNCFVGSVDSKVVAYGVFTYHFFECGMIEMIYVDEAFRRKGISSQFLKYFESICKTDKIFTSTNKSNISMQKSLEKAGFIISGHIDNLDENDPEIVYFKQVTKTTI